MPVQRQRELPSGLLAEKRICPHKRCGQIQVEGKTDLQVEVFQLVPQVIGCLGRVFLLKILDQVHHLLSG